MSSHGVVCFVVVSTGCQAQSSLAVKTECYCSEDSSASVRFASVLILRERSVEVGATLA